METTPNDLRQQQFEIKFRGYNPDDVEVFRDLAATALEEARAEVLKLSEENNHLNERLKHLVAMEETLKAAVIEAQKNAEITIDNAKREAQVTINQAKKEAELIVREAETRREEITGDMHRRMGKLVADIDKIRFIKSQYLNQLHSIMTSQLSLVEQTIAEDKDEEMNIKPPEPEPIRQRPSETQIDSAPPAQPESFAKETPDFESQQADTEPAQSAIDPMLEPSPEPQPENQLEQVAEENAEAIAQTPEPPPQPVEPLPDPQTELSHINEPPSPGYTPEPPPPPTSEQQETPKESVDDEWQDLEKQLNEE